MKLLNQMISQLEEGAANQNQEAQEVESLALYEISAAPIASLELVSLEKKPVAQNQILVVLQSRPTIKQKNHTKNQDQSQKLVGKKLND
jgi:tRNA U34 5-methylaminomethyl-2-thiouridine-forming methyltransferase MnmC